MSFMLDASAVLAVLFDEPGAAFVYANLNDSQMSVVNLSEVYATLMDGGMSFDMASELVSPLPIRLRTYRDSHACRTAQLRAITKTLGLSLGDRACLAQAMIAQLPVLTSDRRLAQASDLVGHEIQLLR